MFSISDKEFEKLSTYLKSNYGIHLREGKKSFLIGRLNNVLMNKNFKNFSEYYDYIISDQTGEAVNTLINKITTNHTYFMREVKHFEYFKNNVLPHLADSVKDKDLRIWSAGCSSGEEPYTLAMIIDEFFGREKLLWDAKILATDISGKVLDIAKKGVYSDQRILSLPANWRQNYFKKFDQENFIVTERIRDQIIFRKFNLIEEKFPFKKRFHVIFCRNVMIYFDNKTEIELVEKFYDFTEPGGYLFIGHSESIERESTRYKYIMPALYRKE